MQVKSHCCFSRTFQHLTQSSQSQAVFKLKRRHNPSTVKIPITQRKVVSLGTIPLSYRPKIPDRLYFLCSTKQKYTAPSANGCSKQILEFDKPVPSTDKKSKILTCTTSSRKKLRAVPTHQYVHIKIMAIRPYWRTGD